MTKKVVAEEQGSLFAPAEPAPNGPEDLGWNAQSTARAPIRFLIPAGTPAGECRSCAATIFWVVTHRARMMPLDPDGTSHFATCPNAASHRRRT